MKESMWGILIILLGATSLLVLVFFQNVTNTDEHNSNLLKEVTEAAMYDSIDYAYLKKEQQIKIDKERFVEIFTRRYAESADKSREYKIEFYDINEMPPKVSVKVTSKTVGNNLIDNTATDVTISDKVDAILEQPQEEKGERK